MRVQELHTQAIELADKAFIEKFSGNIEKSIQLFAEAFLLERRVALAAKEQNVGEPSISVLFKSAASLAINANMLEDAEKLICLALYGGPPYEIAEELRNLLEELYFQRHLQLHEVQLGSNELQFVIAGRGIGYGMAKSGLVLDKISTFEKLTLRTAERKTGRPFRSKGDVPKDIKINFQPFLSVPRAASFGFTIRFGTPAQQLKLDGFGNSEEIIEELVENIDLVNKGYFEQLKETIKDESYFQNFISLSKELAPDGKEINLIGLTFFKNNIKKEVQFTRVRNEISVTSFGENSSEEEQEKTIELIGRLFAANEEQSNIRLKVKHDGNYSISVPDGLNDIVKKYWGEQVKVKGRSVKSRELKLIDLESA